MSLSSEGLSDGAHGAHGPRLVAEMELGFIRDRQRIGIEVAKAKGVYKGGPVTFDHAKIMLWR